MPRPPIALRRKFFDFDLRRSGIFGELSYCECQISILEVSHTTKHKEGLTIARDTDFPDPLNFRDGIHLGEKLQRSSFLVWIFAPLGFFLDLPNLRPSLATL